MRVALWLCQSCGRTRNYLLLLLADELMNSSFPVIQALVDFLKSSSRFLNLVSQMFQHCVNPYFSVVKPFSIDIIRVTSLFMIECWQRYERRGEEQNYYPWLVWLSGLSAGLWTRGLLVQFQVRVHACVVGQVPSTGCVRGNHTLMFLPKSFFHPSPLSESK